MGCKVLEFHLVLSVRILSMFLECEQLIRRMLVLEPTRRYSIQQIRAHRWMQLEGGPSKSTPSSPILGYNVGLGEYNDQILRLMQNLGIDQHNTIMVRGLWR